MTKLVLEIVLLCTNIMIVGPNFIWLVIVF